MRRPPPDSTRTAPLLPYAALFRSRAGLERSADGASRQELSEGGVDPSPGSVGDLPAQVGQERLRRGWSERRRVLRVEQRRDLATARQRTTDVVDVVLQVRRVAVVVGPCARERCGKRYEHEHGDRQQA